MWWREPRGVLRSMCCALGVHEVVQPEFEARLEMVRQTLLHFGIAAAEIERLSDIVRDELYQPFQNLHNDAALLYRLGHARQTLEIELIGRSIGEAAIRRHTGALIVSLLRDDTIHHNPAPEMMLAAGDSLAVLGTPEQRDAFRRLLAPAVPISDGPRTKANGCWYSPALVLILLCHVIHDLLQVQSRNGFSPYVYTAQHEGDHLVAFTVLPF
jgi:K+/H+ antiporter YhaU regulatory subunit KhtT